MVLNDVAFIGGIFSVLYVAINSYVGLRIAKKYFEVKQRVFLFVGITWVGLCSPWWPSSVSFIIALFDGVGLENNPEIYFIIGNLMIPLFLILWMIAITDLLYKEKQKIIIGIMVIFSATFEIILWTLLLTGAPTNYESIGILNGPVNVDYQEIIMVLLLIIIVIIMVTGIQFGRESLKSDNPEIKLKGKLIIVAIILFTVGALVDSAAPLHLAMIILPVTRIILILSGIFFLGGFILPDFMKKIFMRNR